MFGRNRKAHFEELCQSEILNTNALELWEKVDLQPHPNATALLHF